MSKQQIDDLGRPLWQRKAACNGCDDPNIFFPDRGASTAEAKSICATCPVVEECLLYALMNGEKFGIWGGKSERERRRIRKRLNQTDPGWRDRLRDDYGIVK